MVLTSEDFIVKAKEFAEEYVKPISKELDESNRFPEELLHSMVKRKFLGIHYPIEYEGGGESSLTSFNVVKELSKASPGVGLMFIVHWMAVDVLLKYGTDEQKEKYLKDLIKGKRVAAYSISEAVAGSDAAGINTIAEKTEEGWKLNGTKYFCTNGSIADVYLVACKTEPEQGAKGISIFIVEKDSEGLSITDYADKMGFRSSPTTNLVLKDCIIPDENLIGLENKGFKIAMDGLTGGRLGMVAIGIGIAEAAMERAIKHANNRKAFGKPLSKLYSIQEKIASSHISLEAAKGLFEKTCFKRDYGDNYSIESSVAKVFTAKAVRNICYEAMQILGGHGYYKDNDVERYYRDGRLIDIGVGATEVLNMVIGSTILRRYK
ncbi:acyl-CoA dehydrogenase family protein [Maledivibacter halophilus]|uniref:Butyryl-CoA dehydrogenase n=1 Tax=Maledivibacter halophilus TaxID=36842 RepID=A0A1T5ME79_9FIRM|nr:acyl-CoA dehydrogenase family protein [Maledivibacter halophilus]SKC86189.1 butyryl-CoA dehydrogenase [Maledivibacter halophilus]